MGDVSLRRLYYGGVRITPQKILKSKLYELYKTDKFASEFESFGAFKAFIKVEMTHNRVDFPFYLAMRLLKNKVISHKRLNDVTNAIGDKYDLHKRTLFTLTNRITDHSIPINPEKFYIFNGWSRGVVRDIESQWWRNRERKYHKEKFMSLRFQRYVLYLGRDKDTWYPDLYTNLINRSSPSKSDIVYLWDDDNGNTKIGIGQSRDPQGRARQVSRHRNTGINSFFYIECSNALEIEQRILKKYTNRPYDCGDGYTEFRSMSHNEKFDLKKYLLSL